MKPEKVDRISRKHKANNGSQDDLEQTFEKLWDTGCLSSVVETDNEHSTTENNITQSVPNNNKVVPELMNFNIEPLFELTLEEEFRIHELLVRKYNLVDGLHNVYMEIPFLLRIIEQFFKFGISGEEISL